MGIFHARFLMLLILISSFCPLSGSHSMDQRNNSLYAEEFLDDDEISDGYRTPPSEPTPAESEVVHNFKQGDLLYGLQWEARSKYISSLEEKLGKNTLCTADRYNNKFLCGFINQDWQDINRIMDQYNQESGHDFQSQSISEYRNDIIKNIKPGYFDRQRGEYELFRRFSKDAIIYAVKKGYNIHFLLDGLQMAPIINKTSSLGTSYTASELRFIYRNWEKLKNNIIFYEGGREVNAPWHTVTGAEEWAKYSQRDLATH